MKKSILLLCSTAVLALVSCGTANNEDSSNSSASDSGTSQSSGEESSQGEVITNDDLTKGQTTYVDTDGTTKKLTRSSIYEASGYPHVNSYPETGVKQRLLVAPISFQEDSGDSSRIEPTDELYNRVVKTFTADDEEMATLTGKNLYSVQSFYEHSSFGHGAFEVIVLPCWVEYSGTAKSFASASASQGAGVYMSSYVKSWYATEYAKEDHGALGADWNYAWTDFDTDKDGYIDLLWQVYAYAYTSGSDWWAYVTYTGNSPYVSNPNIMTLAWASTNFMASNNGYDPHTFIHETGHALGAYDYYDYTSTWKPMGSVDYMDQNMGDQNAYTKFIFGWAEPWVLKEEDLAGGKTAEITLRASTLTGDSLVLASPGYNGTAFDEYLILELVGPYGICESDYRSSGGFTSPGIRILHVDSRMYGTNHDTYITDPDELGRNGGDNRVCNTFGGRVSVFSDSDYWPVEEGTRKGHISTVDNVNAYFTEVSLIESTYTDENWRNSANYTATYNNTLFKAGNRFNLTGTWGKHFMPSGSNLWNKAVSTTGWTTRDTTDPVKQFEIDETKACNFSMRVTSIEEDEEYGAIAKLSITLNS